MEIQNKKPKVCMLCLEAFEKQLVTLEEAVRKKAELLLLKVDVSTVSEPIICNRCLENIEKCFEFKSSCISIENYINSFKINKNIEIGMMDIYLNKNGNGNIPEGHNVCRLCMELKRQDCCISVTCETSTVTIEVLLTQYFPELDLDTTADPVLCTACDSSLKYYVSFVGKYLEAERKLKACEIPEAKSSEQTELNMQFLPLKAEIKSENDYSDWNEMENSYELEIKKEFVTEEMDMELIKNDDTIKREDFDRVHDDNIAFGAEAFEPLKMYHCETCRYKTAYKGTLQTHMLVHKDDSEVQMHQCDHCGFKTKYKHYIKNHMILHQDISKLKMFQCKHCQYKSKRKYGIERHVLKVHILQRKVFKRPNPKRYFSMNPIAVGYSCEVCRFNASEENELKAHMMSHQDPSDAKVLLCPKCGFKTKHKNSLLSHVQSHQTGKEVMDQCKICNFRTKYLEQHLLLHEPSTSDGSG